MADMDSTIITSESLDDLAALTGLADAVTAITKRAMAGEIDFESAAKKYSDDYATGVNGGYIGRVPISSLQENIKQELEKLDNNQISKIIKGDFGYEIFLLKNKEGGYQSPYIEVANMIKMILENRRVEEEINKIIEKQKEKIYIKYINE